MLEKVVMEKKLKKRSKVRYCVGWDLFQSEEIIDPHLLRNEHDSLNSLIWKHFSELINFNLKFRTLNISLYCIRYRFLFIDLHCTFMINNIIYSRIFSIIHLLFLEVISSTTLVIRRKFDFLFLMHLYIGVSYNRGIATWLHQSGSALNQYQLCDLHKLYCI